NGSAGCVVHEHRGAIAAVVGLADLVGPNAVTVAKVVARAAQNVPAVRYHFNVGDANVRVAAEVAADRVEAGAAAAIRQVVAASSVGGIRIGGSGTGGSGIGGHRRSLCGLRRERAELR